jgi:hypothetical protein
MRIEKPQNNEIEPTSKIFLISPVRGITEEEKNDISYYVKKKESEGYQVFWPVRDNKLEQTDKVSLDICLENLKAIKEAKEVHIWFNPSSEGSRIDIGMVLALDKKLVLANPEAI